MALDPCVICFKFLFFIVPAAIGHRRAFVRKVGFDVRYRKQLKPIDDALAVRVDTVFIQQDFSALSAESQYHPEFVLWKTDEFPLMSVCNIWDNNITLRAS